MATITCSGTAIGNQLTIGADILNVAVGGTTAGRPEELTIDVTGELSQVSPLATALATRDFSRYYITLLFNTAKAWPEAVLAVITASLVTSLQPILAGRWNATIVSQTFNGGIFLDRGGSNTEPSL